MQYGLGFMSKDIVLSVPFAHPHFQIASLSLLWLPFQTICLDFKMRIMDQHCLTVLYSPSFFSYSTESSGILQCSHWGR